VVNVSEAAPILNINDATLSGTFTTNTIQNSPLNGLDFSALTLYVPGSVSTVGTSGTTSIERSLSYTDSVNLNGNRAQANNYTLDGIDLNETFNNLIAYSPAPESLQEIKVLTANSPADDVRHNLSGTGVYALPVGHGKQYLSGVNRFVDEAIGGWKVATAAVVYSGFPETIEGPGNNSNSDGNSRPNQYRKLKMVNRTIDNWYGTDPSAIPCTTPGVDNGLCAFGAPAPNTFGDARNGNTRGPRYLNVDMSAFKDFTTFREQTLGFRFDAFNAFNIVSYGNPDTSITDSNFTTQFTTICPQIHHKNSPLFPKHPSKTAAKRAKVAGRIHEDFFCKK
jgi:hypothetical protein